MATLAEQLAEKWFVVETERNEDTDAIHQAVACAVNEALDTAIALADARVAELGERNHWLGQDFERLKEAERFAERLRALKG